MREIEHGSNVAIINHGKRMRDPTRDRLEYLAQTYQLNALGGLRPHQWLLDNGREFRLGPLPKGVRRLAAKQCYRNSLRLATHSREGRYVYCEGMATASDDFTTKHGWCYDRQTGLIVDRTWEDGVSYFGVPISSAYLARCDELPVLWDWVKKYPIMTGAVPESFWRESL
jgi:hypothetical protein